MTKRNRLASADGQKVLMRGSAIVVASYRYIIFLQFTAVAKELDSLC